MVESEATGRLQGVRLYDDELPPSLKIVPTIYPTSPAIEEMIGQFWSAGEAFDSVSVQIAPPARPLELLERLGPSPFERGEFPLVGFLATTYEKVSRFALSHRAGGDHHGAVEGER